MNCKEKFNLNVLLMDPLELPMDSDNVVIYCFSGYVGLWKGQCTTQDIKYNADFLGDNYQNTGQSLMT